MSLEYSALTKPNSRPSTLNMSTLSLQRQNNHQPKRTPRPRASAHATLGTWACWGCIFKFSSSLSLSRRRRCRWSEVPKLHGLSAADDLCICAPSKSHGSKIMDGGWWRPSLYYWQHQASFGWKPLLLAFYGQGRGRLRSSGVRLGIVQVSARELLPSPEISPARKIGNRGIGIWRDGLPKLDQHGRLIVHPLLVSPLRS